MIHYHKILGLSALAILTMVLPAQGASRVWQGTISQNFTDSANWFPTGTLSASDDLTITKASDEMFPIISSNVGSIHDLTISELDHGGYLQQDSGSITVTHDMRIASATGSTYAINGGTFTENGGTIYIGNGGTGALTLDGSSTSLTYVNGGANLYAGFHGTGSLSVTNGATLTTASNLWVGRSGQGTMTMTDGHLSCSGWLIVGDNRDGASSSSATMTVGGASTINMTRNDLGNCSVAIGVLNTGITGSIGDLTLKDTTTMTSTVGNSFFIGYNGTGTLTLLGSAQLNQNQTGGGNIGRFEVGRAGGGSNATLTLGVLNSPTDHPTLTIASTSAAVIGDADAIATVNINSGTFNGNSTAYTSFGFANSQVTWNQNGGLTNFPANSSPFIGCGNGATVTLNLKGGVFAIPYIKTDTPNPTATVNINFDGGTLKANGSDPNASFPFINVRSNGTFHGTVKTGGAIWDTNGYTDTMQYPLVHDATGPAIDGGLTKLGTGTLSLTANNTFTGPVSVQAGSLVLSRTNATTSVTTQPGTKLTLGYWQPFITTTPTVQMNIAGGSELICSADSGESGVYSNADVVFGDKSYLTIQSLGYYLSTLDVKNLSSVANNDRVIVDIPGLLVGPATVLTYQTRSTTNSPVFLTKTDTVGMKDLTLTDTGSNSIVANIVDQTNTRGFLGSDGSNTTTSWVGSKWKETGVDGPSPNGTTAKAWFNDNVSPATHNVVLDASSDVTLSSMLFNGSYAVSKGTGNSPAAIRLQSTLALNTLIQATAGDSTFAPDIKMAGGDPIVNLSANASLALTGVLSDLNPAQPANMTINGPGTLTLSGANTYSGPTVLNSGTLKVGSASALGAAAAPFTFVGGTLTDAGADVALNKGFTIAGTDTLSPVHNVSFGGAVTYSSGNLIKLGAGTATFNTATVTTNNFGSTLDVHDGALALDGVAGTVYNTGTILLAGKLAGTNPNYEVYPGSHASITVNNVSLVGTGAATIGNYWSGAVTPATQPVGTLTLSGTASMTQTGSITLGYWGGQGYLNVNGSSTLNALNSILVGYNWGDDAANQVGYGEVNVSGGHVVQTAGSVYLGYVGGSGVWKQNAGLTELASTLKIGNNDGNTAPGSGALYLNGGTIQTPGIVTAVSGASTPAATLAKVYFNGGVLKATVNSTDFIANTTGANMSLTVLKNETTGLGAVIDTNGKDVTITKSLTSGVTVGLDGGLAKMGAGTLTLSVASTYTGDTLVNAGVLTASAGINTPNATITVASGATLNTPSLVADSLSIGVDPIVLPGPIVTVPEPSTLVLLALAGLGILLSAWRRK